MIFNRIQESRSKTRNINDYTWSNLLDEGYERDSNNEQNYHTALSVLADSVAKLPISIQKDTDKGVVESMDHYLWDILKVRMNDSMNSFTAIKALMLTYKHEGIAGLYINKDNKGKIEGLYPVKINKIIVDNIGLIKSTKNNKVLIEFDCFGKEGSCFDKDIIILKDNSYNGIDTKATRKYIKSALDTNVQAQSYQNELFSNGMTSKVVIQLVGDMKEDNELKKMQKKFNSMYSSDGRIFTVPAGYNVTPLNLDLVSSQFAELKNMGKKDIVNAIGIPFSLFENGSLTEAENISYLTNTLLPIIVQLEQEMNWKLLTNSDRKGGYKIKININAMLRTNQETQKDIICAYVRNGVYSLEYARKLLGVYSDFDEETVTLPSGQILLSDLIAGNGSWQKERLNNSNVEEVKI